MKKHNKRLRFDVSRWFAPISVAAIGVARLGAAQAADIQVVPALQLMETYVDNILLAPPGQPKDSEMVTQIIPSLSGARFAICFISMQTAAIRSSPSILRKRTIPRTSCSRTISRAASRAPWRRR
jgi:hypothetical protein